jgi:hypothetical protein
MLKKTILAVVSLAGVAVLARLFVSRVPSED